METDIDESRVVVMLIHIRDSLTDVSLMLKDYQADLDVTYNGPATRHKAVCDSLDALLMDV